MKLKDIPLWITNPQQTRLSTQIRNKKLSYLTPRQLNELIQAIQDIESKNIPGSIIEAGCALGGSSIAITKTKSSKRPLKIYDTFAMIPPPSKLDDIDVHLRYEEITSGIAKGINGERYYGYEENLLGKVISNYLQFNLIPKDESVTFIKGLFEDTLNIDASEQIACAHIDCDWYESVTVCLERITPNLVSGGVLILDDYFAWSGCRKAVDNFFANRKGYEFKEKGSLHISKL